MITHVKTKGFKGQDIDEDLFPKTIFVGPNGCGKSSRAHAIALVLMGYIPWAAKIKKKPADVLAAYGADKVLTVEITCNDTTFERRLSMSSKGSVSQRLRVDQQKFSASDFAVALDRAGAPNIFDVMAFMDLSDQKKMNLIFSLFPPQGDVKNIDSQIDKKTGTLNLKNKTMGVTVGVIQRLTARKSEMGMLSGSLPEIRAEIETTTKQVKTIQSALKTAEIANARVQAEEKTLARVQAEKEAAARKAPVETPATSPPPQTKAESPAFYAPVQDSPQPQSKPIPDPATSIQAILDMIEMAGCASCAAKLVAKRELMKFKAINRAGANERNRIEGRG